MSDSNEKGIKRLKLLPEVLPAPTVDTGGRPGPRDRTLSRLSKLMAVAAAGAALSGCGGDEKSGTTGGPATTSAAPATTSAASAEPTAAASGAPTASAATTASADAPDAGAGDAGDAGPHDAGPDAAPSSSVTAKPKAMQPPPKRDRGYMVVDMLPSPSRGGSEGL